MSKCVLARMIVFLTKHFSLFARSRYRVTSLMRPPPLIRPYSRTIPRVLQWRYGGHLFLMSEVPLQCPAFPIILLVLEPSGALPPSGPYPHSGLRLVHQSLLASRNHLQVLLWCLNLVKPPKFGQAPSQNWGSRNLRTLLSGWVRSETVWRGRWGGPPRALSAWVLEFLSMQISVH